jgi:hypothetical protein
VLNLGISYMGTKLPTAKKIDPIRDKHEIKMPGVCQLICYQYICIFFGAMPCTNFAFLQPQAAGHGVKIV